MIVYSGNKAQFVEDVRQNRIHQVIMNEFRRQVSRSVGQSEVASWKNSLQYMSNILVDPEIPEDAGVSIEYHIPLTSKRVDFILTGKNLQQQDTAVIIELKQWSTAKKTTKDGIVSTFLGGGERETSHPSYQAWSYAALIEDFNETVRQESIALVPCAYLHNMDNAEAINDSVYRSHTDKAPVFISSDVERLAIFLKQHVKYGDAHNIMYRIEHGKIKPSRNLADSLVSMLSGNQDFLMIDDQKVAYETALELVHKAERGKKQVLIIEGGPGTGKSVLAINLLVELTKREKVAQYVSKNAAPRAVYQAKLVGSLKKSRIANLFKGSGSYTETERDTFSALLVDEAHRLNAKSGLYSNLGEHQIKEVIHSSRLSVFFIDEAQRVTLKDVGSIAEIKHHAKNAGAEVTLLGLESQFRCNGSDGYLAFVDNVLQIRETANQDIQEVDYDFQVLGSPNALRELIIRKNREANRARMVAGYCWDWVSKKQPQANDIVMPEYGFSAQWNLASDGSLWVMAEESVEQVGCIHTVQGLELDYVGVIIGTDLIVRDGIIITDATQRSNMDSSIKGFKKRYKEDPVSACEQADAIIKNTYRTLMTRGQKGCYLYCTDPETNTYFQDIIRFPEHNPPLSPHLYEGLPLPLAEIGDVVPYENAIPVYSLKAAAGEFSEYQNLGDCDWVALPEWLRPEPGLFVAQVEGESMNRRIPNGSWCVFRALPAGTREGKIVLVQHRDIQDSDTGGQYTVKRYHSEKKELDDGGWIHERIVLKPETNRFGYRDIVLVGNQIEDLKVVGEFVVVLS